MADVEETYTYGTPYTNWDSYNGGGGAVLPPGWPSGSRSGPSGHQLAMKKASEEAARKSCRSAIRGHIYPACEARVTKYTVQI